jgi:hypothetical protein
MCLLAKYHDSIKEVGQFIQPLKYVPTVHGSFTSQQDLKTLSVCLGAGANYSANLNGSRRVDVRAVATEERQWPLSYMVIMAVKLLFGEVVDEKQSFHVDP